MKNNKILLICVAVVLVLLVLLIAFMPKKIEHNWDYRTAPSAEGGQPYDLDILDALLMHSLPNGYSVHTLREYDEDNDYQKNMRPFNNPSRRYYQDHWETPKKMLNEVCKAGTDTSLMVIWQYDWINDNEVISPVYQLMCFAENGGKAMLVMPWYNTSIRYDADMLNFYPQDQIVSPNEYGRFDENQVWVDQYTQTWYEPEYSPMVITTPDSTITLDERICINFIYISKIWGNTTYQRCPNLNHDKDDRLDAQVTPLLINNDEPHHAFAIDIFFPESKGHLYINLLGLPFTNLGLTSPGAHEVVSTLMGKIDDKPVTRIIYPRVERDYESGKSSKESATLSVIKGNEALSYAWTLSVVLVFLVLSCGLMRRHPAVKGIEAEDIDHTDPVAVREYKFRKSPLLHFLFQCSWLYKGSNNYRELLDINYRQLARIVNRYTNTELTTADDKSLKKAAEVFAVRHGRSAAAIFDELKWMQSFGINTEATVSPKQYRYSQQIIEKYS